MSDMYRRGTITLEIEGIDKLLRDLKTWDVKARKEAVVAVADGIERIDTEAQKPPKDGGCPRKSTRLASSHRKKFYKNGLAGEYGPHTDYAVYVHEGTRKMAPRPWLQNAFDKVKPVFIYNLGLALKRDLS
jgi:HK97 gp10 family phage protein